MSRALLLTLFALLLLAPPPARAGGTLAAAALPQNAALDLKALRAAYPGEFRGMTRDPAGRLDLVLADGSLLVYDDGRPRTAREILEHPDVREMLAQTYPLGPLTARTARPRPGFDPGRVRDADFFEALYGRSAAEVRANCRRVAFDGRLEPFQRRFGAADALARVWRRIQAKLPEHPNWAAVLRRLGGTFCWRRIAGTDRLSAHSFGAAVDLDPRLPYWRTDAHPEAAPQRRLRFPQGVVAAFEAEGFIWGGKWSRYDLMHFEYRPALIIKARLLRGEPLAGAPLAR